MAFFMEVGHFYLFGIKDKCLKKRAPAVQYGGSKSENKTIVTGAYLNKEKCALNSFRMPVEDS